MYTSDRVGAVRLYERSVRFLPNYSTSAKSRRLEAPDINESLQPL